jgi:hypothetical protein
MVDTIRSFDIDSKESKFVRNVVSHITELLVARNKEFEVSLSLRSDYSVKFRVIWIIQIASFTYILEKGFLESIADIEKDVAEEIVKRYDAYCYDLYCLRR